MFEFDERRIEVVFIIYCEIAEFLAFEGFQFAFERNFIFERSVRFECLDPFFFAYVNGAVGTDGKIPPVKAGAELPRTSSFFAELEKEVSGAAEFLDPEVIGVADIDGAFRPDRDSTATKFAIQLSRTCPFDPGLTAGYGSTGLEFITAVPNTPAPSTDELPPRVELTDAGVRLLD